MSIRYFAERRMATREGRFYAQVNWRVFTSDQCTGRAVTGGLGRMLCGQALLQDCRLWSEAGEGGARGGSNGGVTSKETPRAGRSEVLTERQ